MKAQLPFVTKIITLLLATFPMLYIVALGLIYLITVSLYLFISTYFAQPPCPLLSGNQ